MFLRVYRVQLKDIIYTFWSRISIKIELDLPEVDTDQYFIYTSIVTHSTVPLLKSHLHVAMSMSSQVCEVKGLMETQVCPLAEPI